MCISAHILRAYRYGQNVTVTETLGVVFISVTHSASHTTKQQRRRKLKKIYFWLVRNCKHIHGVTIAREQRQTSSTEQLDRDWTGTEFEFDSSDREVKASSGHIG